MSERGWLLLVVALYGSFAFGYSVLVPPWEAPDETAHYLVVYHLAREGEMPTREETYEAIQPPAYYWMASGLFRLLERVDPALVAPYRPPLSPEEALTRYAWTEVNFRFLWDMRLLRWLNILAGGAALLFIYQGARSFAGMAVASSHTLRAAIPLATAAWAGLMPQFAYNSASLSNDPLANVAGASLFWMAARICEGAVRGARLLLVVAACVAFPLFIKLTILPMSLTVLAVAATTLLQQQRSHRLRWVGGSVVLALLVPVGLALVAPGSAALLLRTILWRITYIRPDFFHDWSLWELLVFYATSYWGQVGWEAVGLPAIVVGALAGLSLLGWATSLRLLMTRPTLIIGSGMLLYRGNPWWRIPWPVVATFAALLLLGWRLHRSHDPARRLALPPGAWRVIWLAAALTLLASLGALSLLTVAGWYALLPRAATRYLPAIAILLMACLNRLLWLTRVLPVYYQPLLDG
jgi:hypothetical protein